MNSDTLRVFETFEYSHKFTTATCLLLSKNCARYVDEAL